MLEAGARAPEVAHAGEDLGYDVFALEGAVLRPRATVRVRTGIAVEARDPRTGAVEVVETLEESSRAAKGFGSSGR